jgi:N-acetylneuraminic acid mutarotase
MLPERRHSHSSYLHYPYLFVFGGNGIYNKLLNDLWAFNFETLEWKELFIKQNIVKRHYCTLAFKDDELYILGGLDAENYDK